MARRDHESTKTWFVVPANREKRAMLDVQIDVSGPCNVLALRHIAHCVYGDRYELREGLFGDVVITVRSVGYFTVSVMLNLLLEEGAHFTLKTAISTDVRVLVP